MNESSEPVVSVIIPAHNNLDLLQCNLPHTLRILEQELISFELIVVDDSSTEDPEPYLKSLWHTVKVVHLKDCGCFASAFNAGAKKARGVYLLGLNCDTLPSPGFLKTLLKRIETEEEVFAVSPRLLIPNLDYGDEAFTKLHWSHGCWQRYQPLLDIDTFEIQDCSEIFFSVGAAVLYSRAKFNQLGGFDSLFCPFYWEDVDLSWRAWRQGWRCLYEPAATVVHTHRGTINKLPESISVEVIELKNYLLLHWKNLKGYSYWLQHLIFLAGFLRKAFLNQPQYRRSLLLAARQIFEVIERRQNLRCEMNSGKIQMVWSDKQLLSRLNWN